MYFLFLVPSIFIKTPFSLHSPHHKETPFFREFPIWKIAKIENLFKFPAPGEFLPYRRDIEWKLRGLINFFPFCREL